MNATRLFRALIVDDEELARRGVRDLLEDERDIEVASECRNGSEAVDALRAGGIDLLFLDVQMPGMTGFDVLRALDDEAAIPVTIFVTAFDAYAMDAFRAQAIDYLLKPVDSARFRGALDRARAQLLFGAGGEGTHRIARLLQHLAAPPRNFERLLVSADGQAWFIPSREIVWIEAAANYARIHTVGGNHLVRETMHALEAQLDPNHFIRIHRSAIVSVDHIERIEAWGRGDHRVLMRGGTWISLTRKYRAQLEARIGKRL